MMPALEYLESMEDEIQNGIALCHKHPDSVTKNVDLAAMLTTISTSINYAVKEILKGNVK